MNSISLTIEYPFGFYEEYVLTFFYDPLLEN